MENALPAHIFLHRQRFVSFRDIAEREGRHQVFPLFLDPVQGARRTMRPVLSVHDIIGQLMDLFGEKVAVDNGRAAPDLVRMLIFRGDQQQISVDQNEGHVMIMVYGSTLLKKCKFIKTVFVHADNGV